jgi:fido (protein-threonine AMPylation protein)
MKITRRQQQIMLSILSGNTSLSQIFTQPTFAEKTERTLQRDLSVLVNAGMVERTGGARAVKYSVANLGKIDLSLSEDTLKQVFADENRQGVNYDFSRLDDYSKLPLFSEEEYKDLNHNNKIFLDKLQTASPDIIRRERERITIELSWKSSLIEGNTYSLLETETLIKEGIPAPGKSEEETTMVLNHKKALDFSEKNRDVFSGHLKPQHIIELHKILAEGLMGYGIRNRLVGITGSSYKPLENQFQITEELSRLCDVINAKESVFDKALLAFVYICYIQPFNDGNKRSARILANAILYAHDSFPLSLRAVSVDTYKLAILAFYELGILGNAKQVFIDQAKFSVDNYAI